MRELAAALRSALARSAASAYCRLVETRGSTPQKAGAIMLVFPDGSQFGTLGGGCVEAEAKRRALAAALEHRSEIADFRLDQDYGWDDGLICGGRMRIHILPISATTRDYFDRYASLLEEGEGCTEATMFALANETVPADPPTVLFDSQGELAASLHVEQATIEEMRGALRSLSDRPRPYTIGGTAYLPALKRCPLVIVGGGHVGQAVAELAEKLEFDVWVIDDREEIVSSERFPTAQRRIAGAIESVLPALEITSSTYCLIVTRGHAHDEQALYYLADRGARYVGLIGSRRKIKLIFADLLEQGVSRAALERVYAPLGIEIGSQTVPEIAVSICAELVAHRNLGRIPGRPPAIEF